MKRHVIALVGALAAVLAFVAGPAQAQSVQGVEQAASTGQSASSSASSTQIAPSNSNISVRIGSPGDGGSVSQANNSAAGSFAGNAASTDQAVGQSQGGGGEQAVGQSADTGQKATSEAVSEQYKPSNSNISVRIHSPGDDGDVEQSNNSLAKSKAGNLAETTQEVGQEQAGGGDGKSKCCPGSGVQAVDQKAETGQKAESEATSKQIKPSNSNISVRIHSPGDDGDVSQSNNSFAGSFAGNKAETTQGVAQEQAGGDGKSKCCHGAGVQAVGQKSETWQKADSEATSIQEHASNENIPVRIKSPGDNGSVSQENNSAALSFAGNAAKTEQGVEQSQGGGCCGSNLVQAVGQKAKTGQWADSEATSVQKGAKNSNKPVRIHSYGDDGDVEQSNNSLALSKALNAAKTEQGVEQSQARRCGCDGKDKSHDADKGKSYGADKDKSNGAGVQAVGQWAETWQKADSDATSKQFFAKNVNAPVREKSKGGGGSVSQSNNSLAGSLALNLARTSQWVRQEQ